jgi:hypothetical protein
MHINVGWQILTVRYIENNDSTYEQSNDLHRIPNRLELSSYRYSESQVVDNDRREGVDDTIRNSYSKDTDEYQDSLAIQETQLDLALVECLVLDHPCHCSQLFLQL